MFFLPLGEFGLLEALHYFTTLCFSLKRVLAYLLVLSMDAWVIIKLKLPKKIHKRKRKEGFSSSILLISMLTLKQCFIFKFKKKEKRVSLAFSCLCLSKHVARKFYKMYENCVKCWLEIILHVVFCWRHERSQYESSYAN
jgi:hypothetical protein